MSDEDKENFIKHLDSKKNSLEGSVMTNEMLSQANKSNKIATLEQSRRGSEERNRFSSKSGAKIENNGRASIGNVYGWAHFDVDNKPLLSKKSGELLIYNDDGKIINDSSNDLLDQSNAKSPDGKFTPSKSFIRTPEDLEREALTDYDNEMKKKQDDLMSIASKRFVPSKITVERTV